MKNIQIKPQYKDGFENVFNFFDPNTQKGRLISFRIRDLNTLESNGELVIDLYRLDEGITVNVSDKREFM